MRAFSAEMSLASEKRTDRRLFCMNTKHVIEVMVCFVVGEVSSLSL